MYVCQMFATQGDIYSKSFFFYLRRAWYPKRVFIPGCQISTTPRGLWTITNVNPSEAILHAQSNCSGLPFNPILTQPWCLKLLWALVPLENRGQATWKYFPHCCFPQFVDIFNGCSTEKLKGVPIQQNNVGVMAISFNESNVFFFCFFLAILDSRKPN